MSASQSLEELREYESQLAEVDELLLNAPDDPSLLSLRADVLSLLQTTRSSLEGLRPDNDGEAPVQPADTAAAEDATLTASLELPEDAADDDGANVDGNALAGTAAVVHHSEHLVGAEEHHHQEPPKKRAKKIKDFEVPQHLAPRDTDSAAEKNRKRRAIKTLKNKWRERKKEVESEKKQKSWQSFQKKKKVKSNKDKSIFSTHDGDAKVGVVSVSGRQLTEFGERKRHK